MNSMGYQRLGGFEGGIRYNIQSNSYVVWIREIGPNNYSTDLTPVYGNGVDASNRLDDELLRRSKV